MPERIRHTPLVAMKYNRQNRTENPLEVGGERETRPASHSRPISKVADLDSRSGLSRGPDGLVVGFRRFGIAR